MGVILGLYQEAALVKVFNYLLSCLVSVHAGIGRIVLGYPCIFGEYRYHLKAVSLADLEVVGVVSRSDLDNARTKLHVNIAVGDYGNLAADQRKDQSLAYCVLVSLVVGIYCNSSIAQQGLGSGGSQLKISRAVLEGVSQVPEMACLLLKRYLGIGEGGAALGAPVDYSLASVDQSLVVVFYKYFLNGL